MKITTSEIQKNDFASLAFRDTVKEAVKRMRQIIDDYKDLDKINTAILGYVRALSLLCQHCGEADNPIMTEEATEWKAVLLDYFQHNKRKIPKELQEDFVRNLTSDLDNIVAHSTSIPLFLWEDEAKERDITITVKNQELKDRYTALAEAKYSTLGGALNNYLKECLEKLEGDLPQEPIALKPQKLPSFNPTFLPLGDGDFSYFFSDFELFLTPKQRKEEKEISAYDVEKKVKKHLKEHHKNLLKHLKFDCESSLFSVQSNDLQALNELNAVLLKLLQKL